MPFVLMFMGIILTVAGVRNTQSDFNGEPGLYSLIKGDFTGQQNFGYWVLAVVGIGSLGYIEQFKQFSNYMLALIFIVLILAEEKANGAGGFFAKFNDAVKTGLTQTPTPAPTKNQSGVSAFSATGATGPNPEGLGIDAAIQKLLTLPGGQGLLAGIQHSNNTSPAN